MAAAVVGGAFLSSFLSVMFDRLASQNVIEFFKGRRLNGKLLEKLKIMMISVEGVLNDAEEKQITRHPVKKWLDELKDTFYEADDFLDEIAYAALKSEMEAGPQTSIDRVWKFWSSNGPVEKQLESRLVEILEKLEYLVNQKSALGLKEGIGEKPSSQKVPTTSVMVESDVYGREKDKEVIVQQLLSDNADCKNLGLIPIVGMGGVGKTTLAQLVYNDSRVKEGFEFKAWISVSEEFDVLKVTRDILIGVSSQMPDINTLDHFQVELKKILKDKKFLLVLDDVWTDNYSQWDILLGPLKAAAQGSKIVITTRHQSVASVMGVVRTHRLNVLSDEQCWLLFSKHAFDGRNSRAHPNLEQIGREIARKCNGLPLAAKSLGGLLRCKQKPEEWKRVLNSDIWSSSKDNILPALRLSYHFLPSHLKRCFEYCAIFPKSYVFKEEELVLLWKAEGYLGQGECRMEMEIIGKEYFDDLVSRSFFHPTEDVYRPGFIMHDLINDLAKYVAGEFCLILDDDDEDSCKITPRTRHLSYTLIKGMSSNKFEDITSAPLLRTFLPVHLLEWWEIEDIDSEVVHDLLSKLERLRVLSLSQYHTISKLHELIGNLKHLRYLNLSYTTIKILPESFCYLYNLEIVLLAGCLRLVELPLNMSDLANLCLLDVGKTPLQKMPPQMGKLKKLQKLSDFVVGKDSGSSIEELENLQHLRGSLVIRNLQNVRHAKEALRANMKGKIHLKKLNLVWNGEADDSLHSRLILEQLEPHENVETLTVEGYEGTRFPDWFGGSPFLGVVRLRLEHCRHCCQLPPLGQLVSLKDLSIIDFEGVVTIGPEFYGSGTSTKKPFQCLEVLRFEDMHQWQEWIMCGNEHEGQAFPLLKELHIIKCPVFKHAPPQHLPSLTVLCIRECKQFVGSLPRTPSILTMELNCDLILRDGKTLSTYKFRSPLLNRIDQLSYGLFNSLGDVEISRCDSLLRFPLESFSKLRRLSIFECSKFESLSALEAPDEDNVSLISLEIWHCPNFVSFPKAGLATPNLKKLSLKDCSHLESLPDSMHSRLRSLEKLSIRGSPKLKSFPEGGLPSNLQSLRIVFCTELINGRKLWNLHRLPNLLHFKIGHYARVECFPEESLLPSTLTSLKIWDFRNLESLEHKGYQHLTSLKSLSIGGCPQLRFLPEEGFPTSLTSLHLRELQNLESVVNSKTLQLTNLNNLTIGSCPKLRSVPEEGLPSTITSLEIRDFHDLESLDSRGLQNLTSLKELKIDHCFKLQSLPEEGLPPSLSSLSIHISPLLEKRCQREKGEDWPKISHIAKINIRF